MSIVSTHSFVIDAEGIDEAAELVFSILQEASYDRKTCLRLQLSLDGILFDWMERGLKGATCVVRVEKRFGRRTVSLEAKGRLCVEDEELVEESFYESFVSNLGLEWDVSVEPDGVRATLGIPKTQAHAAAVNIIAVVGAIGAGLAVRTLPEGVRETVIGSFATPLFDAFIGLLSAIVGPMVFFSVVVAVVGAGDLKSLKGMGKATLLRVLSCNFIGVCVACVMGILFFGVPIGDAGASGEGLDSIVSVMFDIVPHNVVDPFLSGNILQIVCLAFGSGVGMLALRRKLPLLAKISIECDLLIQEVLSVLMRFLPVFIFLAVLLLFETVQVEMLTSLLAALGCAACVMIVLVLGTLFATAFSAKMSPLSIARACLPGGLIGLTTASSAAAYTVVQDTMKKEFGISSVYAKFAQPIVTAFFQPGASALFMILVFFAASFSHTEIGVSTLVMALVMCFLLGTAAPPVPGGMVMLYGVVLTQTGLGMEALALFMAADFVFDALATGAETFMRPAHVLRTAIGLGEVDLTRLNRARSQKQ